MTRLAHVVTVLNWKVFVYHDAVMSIVSPTGPSGRTLQYADDGFNFRVLIHALTNLPKAPGLYRSELTQVDATASLPTWGIAMATYGGDPYLIRYECVWGKP